MIQTNSIFDKINFNGGNLSSDGGSILLSQFLEKINLKKLGLTSNLVTLL